MQLEYQDNPNERNSLDIISDSVDQLMNSEKFCLITKTTDGNVLYAHSSFNHTSELLGLVKIGERLIERDNQL